MSFAGPISNPSAPQCRAEARIAMIAGIGISMFGLLFGNPLSFSFATSLLASGLILLVQGKLDSSRVVQFGFALLVWIVASGLAVAGFVDDTEEHMVQVAVFVIAQADRIPPEFAEEAEQKLQAMSPTALPRLLRMMQELNPETQERLGTCGQEIIRRAQQQELDIPVSWLGKFAASTRQKAAVRRTALRWLEQAKPGTRDTFLLEHLNDDVFRRDAIELCLLKATQPASGPPSETSHLLKKPSTKFRLLIRPRSWQWL